LDRVDIGCTVAALIALLVAALSLDGLSIIASVIVGAIITFAVTRYYYRRAGEELRAESGELRRYIDVLLGYLEDAGHITVTRDASGRPVRVQVIKGGGIASHSVGGGTITTPQPGEPEESGPPQTQEGVQRRWWRRWFGG
jgi:hypothetical protein